MSTLSIVKQMLPLHPILGEFTGEGKKKASNKEIGLLTDILYKDEGRVLLKRRDNGKERINDSSQCD